MEFWTTVNLVCLQEFFLQLVQLLRISIYVICIHIKDFFRHFFNVIWGNFFIHSALSASILYKITQ